jgi:hypothetical protein
LKRQEKDIVSSVIDSFNDEWKPKVQGINPTLKYNPSRGAIGIYLGEQLVIDNEDLSEAERAVVQSLYSTLEKRLDRLRLPNEEWVDSIPGEKDSSKEDSGDDNLPF